MRLSMTLMLSAFVVLVGSGAAFAQPAPATQTTKPAAAAPAAPSAKSTAADTDKKAISKACSDQATAKGLHGKERKAFRSECKKNGGKPA
jgi:subtilisin family serine protease